MTNSPTNTAGDLVTVPRAVLQPFSDLAGVLFARNFNADDQVVAIWDGGKSLMLPAGDFFALRHALASPKHPVGVMGLLTRSAAWRLAAEISEAYENNATQSEATDMILAAMAAPRKGAAGIVEHWLQRAAKLVWEQAKNGATAEQLAEAVGGLACEADNALAASSAHATGAAMREVRLPNELAMPDGTVLKRQSEISKLWEAHFPDGDVVTGEDEGELADRYGLDALFAAALSSPAPEGEANPVAYANASQIAALKDPEDQAGEYTPLRRTPFGNFQMPLYAVPPAPEGEAAQGVEPTEAREKAIHDLAEAISLGYRAFDDDAGAPELAVFRRAFFALDAVEQMIVAPAKAAREVEPTEAMIDAAEKAWNETFNGTARFFVGNNWRECLRAIVKSALAPPSVKQEEAGRG